MIYREAGQFKTTYASDQAVFPIVQDRVVVALAVVAAFVVPPLAAQFFLIWLFNKVPWFVNYASSGTITAPPRTVFGVMVTGPTATPQARYVTALALVAVGALVAKNLVRGRVGRSWMAIRD